MDVDTKIRLYKLEDSDETEEVEESYILVVHNSSLAVYKQNLVKRKFPYIDIFDHGKPAVFNAMPDLTSGLFEHLDINSSLDVDQRVAYTQLIIRGAALKNYKAVLLECKHLAKYLARDSWDLVKLKKLSTDYFYNWEKKDRTGCDGYAYLVP